MGTSGFSHTRPSPAGHGNEAQRGAGPSGFTRRSVAGPVPGLPRVGDGAAPWLRRVCLPGSAGPRSSDESSGLLPAGFVSLVWMMVARDRDWCAPVARGGPGAWVLGVSSGSTWLPDTAGLRVGGGDGRGERPSLLRAVEAHRAWRTAPWGSQLRKPGGRRGNEDPNTRARVPEPAVPAQPAAGLVRAAHRMVS